MEKVEITEDTTTSVEAELELVSKPELNLNSSIDENIISLDHSFGFDCKKLYNLVLMDKETLVFASGNLIHFFNVSTSTVTTRRTAGGGGIGCIAKNPNSDYPHLTVGENGRKPTIYIYKFPEMELVAMLKKGTKRQFTFLDYTVDGELLASQGGDPDYLLTIWDWKRGEIKLRAKSFSNDVANLMFSPYIPDQLTTCGLGHIKFWKMSSTFTGLKLQGLIGRFGKTEICDIYGICSMPDEKVLSGCEWGNILVWENGLIKLEVCKKNRKKCHQGCITQIFMRNSEEIMTVGTDGYIRIWFWETVELSDPPEHDRFVEIEPSHEFHVGQIGYNAQLLKIIKNKSDDADWYAQDGYGGIWWCDLATEVRPQKPKQLYRCHAGEIVAMDTSPISQHVATLGQDGRLYVYDYVEKQMIYNHQFIAAGNDLIWLPVSVDPTGAVMILGFSDGVVRVISFNFKVQNLEQFQLVQAVKCHNKPITKISINPKGSIFVSASLDSTIFIHQLVKDSPLITLQPIGFITVPSPVTCINWNPTKWSTAILGCKLGDVVQIDLPERTNSYTDTSFHLNHIPTNHFKFKSVKSQIRRHEKVKKIEDRKEQKRQRKLIELEKMKNENPEIDIDEENYLEDSEEEEVLEKIHIPDPPNPILWIQFTSDDTLWLSVGGFDAGYIYEHRIEDGELLSFHLISEADEIEIHSYMYLDNYLIFGMGDGKIRINLLKENWRDLSDFWQLSMHDNLFGKIPVIKFSFDNKYLFSIGSDGNIFSYSWNLPLQKVRPIIPTPVPKLIEPVNDINDPNALSLEQIKENEKEEKRLEISTDNKNKVLEKIKELRKEFDEIMKKNSLLPESQRLKAELELDDRISDDLQDKLDRQMEVVRRKKEFDFEKVKLAGRKLKEHFIDPIEFPIKVSGINNGKTVYSFRVRKLGDTFARLHDEMEMRIKQAAIKRRRINIDALDLSLRTVDTESSIPPVESFLIGLNPDVIETKLESKMRRLLNKYRERKSKEVSRKKEWQAVNAERPNPDMDHPIDKKLIEEATQTIGNYKLKTDPNYESNEEERETVEKKFSELIQVRKDVFNIRNDYNHKIHALRDKKKDLIEFIERKLKKLDEIHLEIPEKDQIKPQISVSFDVDQEFPERNLDLRKYLTPEAFHAELIRGTGEKTESTNTREILEKNLMDVQRIVLKDSETTATIDLSPNLNEKTFKSVTAANKKVTDWEDELKNLRVRRRLFEQQQILEKISQRITDFDEEIDKLCDERYEVEVRAKFKDIYLLTLNNELMIIKDFESLEEGFADEIAKNLSDEKLFEKRIKHTAKEVEEFERHLEELLEAKKEIEEKFIENCLSNKFAPFFKKIFKRKSGEEHETRILHDEKEMSESGESTSGGSSMSGSVKEFKGSMKNLSEDECPKNCDRKLYNLTFDLRREKHEIEESITRRQSDIECYKIDLETLEERREQAKKDQMTNRGKLSELMHKKQTMLNDVDTVVILKMDQMQYFKNQPEFENISNTLLFNNNNVTKLYSRVGKLALETIEAKRKHRINVIHLAKMKTDIKFMEKQITDLKDGTSQAMMKKFGRVIDLNEVEETILRRFSFEMQVEMRANADDIKRQYHNKINELKKQKIEKEVTLNRVIQNATEKLNILTVLEEERNFLHRILTMQARRKELKAAGLPYRDFENDYSKLKEISNHQKEQIEMLQREIRALTLKTKTFVDARQDFDSLNYSITQLRGECRFEDSICSNPDESMLSSTRATTPDHEVYNEILKLVKKFAEETLSHELEETEISNISINVSKYLTNVAMNFPSNEADEILPEIINNCQNFLPKHVFIGPEKIANLVAQAIGNFDESNEVSRCDVLQEIMSNTIEATNQTAISSDSYLQYILTEIFKQMIITMRVSEISSPDCANEIVARLSRLNAVNVRNIQVDVMINEILEYASENLEDDVNGEDLKRVIVDIITKLSV